MSHNMGYPPGGKSTKSVDLKSVHILRYEPGMSVACPRLTDMNTETVAYSSLSATTERGLMCYTCDDYKGFVDCPNDECGMPFCITCTDGCESCGLEIDWSK